MGNSRIVGSRAEDGAVYIRTTTPWVMGSDNRMIRTIECIQACVFTTLTDVGCTPTDCHLITLAAMASTHGKFTAITLASGEIKGYY